MPLSDAQITMAEIVVAGRMAAGGGDTVDTINQYHYFRVTGGTSADKAALDAAFDNNIMDEMTAALNNRWTHVATKIRWLNDAEDPYMEFPGGANGLVAGDSLPSDKCVYFLIRTLRRGKRYRGAKFLGPVSEADTTTQGDVLNTAALVRWRALALALNNNITDTEGNTWEPSIFTRKGSITKTNPTVLIHTRYNDVLVNQRLTSLSRRKTRSVF